jgi:hypothetical protein
MTLRRREWLAGIAVAIAAASCRRSAPRPASTLTSNRMRILLYDGIGIHGYDYSELERLLDTLDPADAVATVTEVDVLSYRVDERMGGYELVLSDRAAARLRALRPSARSVHDLFDDGPFVVYFDGNRLYGGRSYLEHGAAGLRHPVLHWREEGGRIVMRIRPEQGGRSEESERRISAPELEAFFAAAGRLERVPP